MRWPNKILVPLLAVAVLAGACAPTDPTTASTPAPGPATTSGEDRSGATAPPGEVVDPEAGSLIETAQWGEVPANLVNVLLTEGFGRQEAELVAETLGGEVVGWVERISYFQIRIGATSEAELAAALDLAAGQEGVEAVTPELEVAQANTTCTVEGPLQDSWFTGSGTAANAEPFRMIGLERAWAAARAGGVALNPVKVGVIDTALHSRSSEISGPVRFSGLNPEDLTERLGNQGGKPREINHGTGVAHVIGADPSNGGMVGVGSILGGQLEISVSNIFRPGAWDDRDVEADPDDLTQVTFADGRAWGSRLLADIARQVEAGATVVNLSLEARVPGPHQRPIAAATRRLLESFAATHPRVVFVAAAGNKSFGLDGRNGWPGGLPLSNLITVGALNTDGTAAGFTNYAIGDGEVTISAPGVGVPVGQDTNGKPIHNDGTSFSAPMVAAAAALLQSLNPGLTAAEIKEILRTTAARSVEGATTVTIPDNLGGGVLRVDQAVREVINQMRAGGDSPRPPLSWEDIEALSGLTATASLEEADTYVITASVGAVEETGTDLVLTLLSDGSIAGDAAQALTGPGSALWIVELETDSGTAAVSRSDTGVGCTLELEPASLDGLWVGEGSLTSVELSDETDVVEIPWGDGGETITMTREECEALIAEGALEDQEPFPLEVGFVTSGTGVGTVSGTDDTGEVVSGSWLRTGNTVTFELAAVDGEGVAIFEGTVEGEVMTGTWSMPLEGLVVTGVFSMVRVGGK